MASSASIYRVDSNRDPEESSNDGMSSAEESVLDQELEGDYIRYAMLIYRGKYYWLSAYKYYPSIFTECTVPNTLQATMLFPILAIH